MTVDTKTHLANPLGNMSGLITVTFSKPELDSSRTFFSSRERPLYHPPTSPILFYIWFHVTFKEISLSEYQEILPNMLEHGVTLAAYTLQTFYSNSYNKVSGLS